MLRSQHKQLVGTSFIYISDVSTTTYNDYHITEVGKYSSPKLTIAYLDAHVHSILSFDMFCYKWC